MKKGVYLGGPMEGVDTKVMKAWRNQATMFFGKYSIPVKDPCRRKAFHDEVYSANLAKRIVKMDLQDISNCNIVLANLTKEVTGPGKAWGTIAEVAHAHTKNKIIIVVLDEGVKHPFIEFYATEIHTRLEDALNATRNYFL